MRDIAIHQLSFAPVLAIARLGGSSIPMEAFSWSEDPRRFGAGRTVIVPRVSFDVSANGSIHPYLPRHLRFKDQGQVRPVCPFLELHVRWSYLDGTTPLTEPVPLTPALLSRAGLEMASLSFQLVAANRKAAKRTGDEACAFEARELIPGNHHAAQRLMAYSHTTAGQPLVVPDRPIYLGKFQVIRPSGAGQTMLGAALDTIRVRFTPARGEVYGPPSAVKGQTNDSRNLHRIVPPRNRILNPQATWCGYKPDPGTIPTPQPASTYDGARDLQIDPLSWGVVDDTCEVLIHANLVNGNPENRAAGNTLTAAARVIVGPPHFAPDRRPFYSLVDELADRDPESVADVAAADQAAATANKSAAGLKARTGNRKTRASKMNESPKYIKNLVMNESPEDIKNAVIDLFRRTLESAALVNVERQRVRAIDTNRTLPADPAEGLPAVDEKTMTLRDRVGKKLFLSDRANAALKLDSGENSHGDIQLRRVQLAQDQHDELADPEYLLRFLVENEQRLRDIIRPPYANFPELKRRPQVPALRQFRDLRRLRDFQSDMRMPPYMRDSDFSALSITRRQWEQIDRLIQLLKEDLKSSKAPTSISSFSHMEARSRAYQARKQKPRNHKK